MIRSTCIFIMIFVTMSIAKAQTGMDGVLDEIEQNNKSIATGRQYVEAQKLSYKTGLNPENPKVEYDHLPGRPEGAGTQRDFSLTQGFDFPTSYGKRKNLSHEQIRKAELEFDAARQRILLEAKQACIDFIYRKKLQSELDKRMRDADALSVAINRQMHQGESGILDVNKVRLLQLEIKNESALNIATMRTLQHKIDELNGGNPLDLSTLDYPLIEPLPPFEALDSVIEANDPEVKVIKQQKQVSEAQVRLTRAISLPKFEGGYHRQTILGQTYEGLHVAMTVPLWENKSRVKSDRARLVLSEFQVAEHRNEHYYENKQFYEQYLHWQSTLAEYQGILASANNEELLNKALQAGQLSLIEYLMEVRYFYHAILKSLEAERALHEQIAELYKFEM